MKHIALALVLLAVGCSRSADQQKAAAQAAAAASQPAPVEVEVARAETRRTDRAILVVGSLAADETVSLVSEVPGKVAAVRADFGQLVRKGDVLVELDKTEYQLQVDRARAAVTQALARVGLDPGETGKSPIITPAMRQAQAQLEDARSKFRSAEKLVQSGDIAQERFIEAEKAYRAREAAYEAAKDEMRTLLAGVEALQADLRLAEKRLRDTAIRAPFDGSVSDRKAAPGQYVKDNTTLLTLVKTYPIRLRAEVPESAAGVVRAGTQLEFTTEAAPDARFWATVRELNPSLTEQSRTLVIEARLDRPDARLRPGMFVQVRLLLARNVETVVVPRKAVYNVAGLTKFFSVEGGKITEHRVSPGQMIGEWMEVPAGTIASGATVVVSNLPQLTEGQQVQIRPGRG